MFKKWKEKRQQRQQRKVKLTQLSELTQLLDSVKKLEKSGLLAWNEQQHRIFIALPLATVMIVKGMEAFEQFLNNIVTAHVFAAMQKGYNDVLMARQREAIKARVATGKPMQFGEANSIRRAVVDTLQFDDIDEPEIGKIEFFIISDSTKGYDEARIAFVGSYDPENQLVDMAPWEDVEQVINSSKD